MSLYLEDLAEDSAVIGKKYAKKKEEEIILLNDKKERA